MVIGYMAISSIDIDYVYCYWLYGNQLYGYWLWVLTIDNWVWVLDISCWLWVCGYGY